MREPNEYYCNEGFEVIDVIEAYNLDFMDGNVLKYIARAGKRHRIVMKTTRRQRIMPSAGD